jgi:hypothetical protein
VRYARRDTPDRVTSTTLQQLSKYSDIMIRISHTLQMNITVLNKLLETARKRQKLDSKECVEGYESFQESIQLCITEHEFLKHHVALVRSSSQELGALVCVQSSLALDRKTDNYRGSKYNHADGWKCDVDSDPKDDPRSTNNEDDHFYCAYILTSIFHIGTKVLILVSP